MKEIAIIIPYFGKLPEWIQLFINSCENSKDLIDFYLFTDDASSSNLLYPENVFLYEVSFSWLQERIRLKCLGHFEHAYKLCDYKPIYGFIFDDYIGRYKYWGYCDVDTILGEVSDFLRQINYSAYDRIGLKGHFTLYKNNDVCKNLFRYKGGLPKFISFDFMSKTAYPCHFDECDMNIFCNQAGLKFYKQDFALQTTILQDFHLHTFGCHEPELFVYERGKVLQLLKLPSGSIKENEFMYIHFQDRKVMPVHEKCEDSFLITHLGFIPFDRSNIDYYFEKYGGYDTEEERQAYLKKCLERKKRGVLIKLRREFKTYGIRAFYNIFLRYAKIQYLKREGLF